MKREVLEGLAEVWLVSLALAQPQLCQDREVANLQQLGIWQDQGAQQREILLQGFSGDSDDVLCQLHPKDLLSVLYLVHTSA